jgi:hypothetical protein
MSVSLSLTHPFFSYYIQWRNIAFHGQMEQGMKMASVTVRNPENYNLSNEIKQQKVF